MKRVQSFLIKHVKWFEYFIAALLVVALLVIAGRMVLELWDMALYGETGAAFTQLLSSAFSLIIGVEFIKMIIKPTSENVLEVILFTIARFLVVEHSSMLTCLLGVIALAIIFFIRKFLFCEIVQSQDEDKATKRKKTALPPGAEKPLDNAETGNEAKAEK